MASFSFTCQPHIVIPSDVTEIPYRAYFQCTSLVSIVLHAGIVSIGSQAFQGCTSLASPVNLPGLLTMGGNAFRSTSIPSANLGTALSSLASYVFYDCSSLTSVYAPN
eukprot:1450402-Prymnesium_polylepis.1